MWFGSSAALNSLSQSDMTINSEEDVIRPVPMVRDFGVHLDSELSKHAHISKITQTCFFHLRRLRQIRRLLGRNVTANLVTHSCCHGLTTATLMLAGLPYTTIALLQRVVNCRETRVRLTYESCVRPQGRTSYYGERA